MKRVHSLSFQRFQGTNPVSSSVVSTFVGSMVRRSFFSRSVTSVTGWCRLLPAQTPVGALVHPATVMHTVTKNRCDTVTKDRCDSGTKNEWDYDEGPMGYSDEGPVGHCDFGPI